MSDLSGLYVPTSGCDINKGATIVVNGFDPIDGQLDSVIDYYARTGDVFSFTYSDEVIISGNPELLPRLVGKLCMRVSDIVSDYGVDNVRTVGVSLGACIAMNIQDRLALTQPGVYGAAGVNVANNFMRNPVFRLHNVPQIYKNNGHTIESVREAWKNIDIHEDRKLNENMRFWSSASVLDPVVWYPLAKRNLSPYTANGSCVLQRSSAVFHTATINEMTKHIAEATAAADSLRV